MAKKTDKKKPSRNVLVVGVAKTKGRGKNKTTTVKPKRGALGTRLYCVALTKEKRGAKARFQCFGSFEEASVALLDPAKLPVPAARPPAFSKASLDAMEKAMSGLRGALPARGRGRGLRGTPEEHLQRQKNFADAAAQVRRIIDDEHLDLPERERQQLNHLHNKLRTVARENDSWADPELAAEMVDPREPWGYVHADREVKLLERYGDNDLRAALSRARGTHF